MTLERRLAKLEARREVTGAETGAGARLAAMLDRMNAAITAEGDYSHRAGASKIENFCRACLRGDAATAAAILGEAIGGRP